MYNIGPLEHMTKIVSSTCKKQMKIMKALRKIQDLIISKQLYECKKN